MASYSNCLTFENSTTVC